MYVLLIDLLIDLFGALFCRGPRHFYAGVGGMIVTPVTFVPPCTFVLPVMICIPCTFKQVNVDAEICAQVRGAD